MGWAKSPDGKLFQIDEQEALQALSSGQWYDLPEGTMLHFVDESGIPYELDVSDPQIAAGALQAGHKIEPDEASNERWLEEKYGGRELEAGALEFLDVGTFGAAKLLATETGLVDRREWEQIVERADTGPIVGGVGAFLVPGTAASKVTKGFRAAEKALRAGTATKLGGAAVKAGVWGTEAAVWGLHHGISESIDKDLPLLSEETFSHVGPFAIFGVSAAGATSVLGGLTKRALRNRLSGRKAMQANAPAAPDPWELRAAGEAPRPPVTGMPPNWRSRVTGKAYGMNPEEIQAVTGKAQTSKQARQAIVEYPQRIEKASSNVTKDMGEFMALTEANEQGWYRSMKREFIDPLVKRGGEVDVLVKTKTGLFDTAMSDIRSVIDAVAVGKKLPAAGTKARRLLTDLAQQEKELSKLMKLAAKGPLPDDANVRVFMAADNAKKQMDQFLRGFKSASPADDAVIAEVEAIRRRFRKHLERADLFGDGAGLQKEVNAAYTAALELETAGRKNALTHLKRVSDFGRQREYAVDPGKVKKLIGKIGTEEAVVAAEWNQNFIKGRLELARRMAPAIEGGEKMLQRMTKLADSLSANFEQANNLNILQAVWGRVKSGGVLSGELQLGGTLYIAGHILGGYVYGILGAALGTATLPKNVAFLRGAMERLAGSRPATAAVAGASQGSRQQATSKIRKLLGLTYDAKVGIAAEMFSGHMAKNREKNPYKSKDRDKDLKEIRKELVALSNPQALQERLKLPLEQVAKEVPGLALGVQMTAQRAVSYLSSLLPKGSSGLVDVLQGKDPRYPRHEISRFFTGLDIVMRPDSVFDKMGERTLTKAHMEALKAVYPEMTSKWAQMMLATAQEASVLPYWVQLEMEKFLGFPITAGSGPDSLMILQGNFAAEDQSMAAQPPKGWDHSKQTAGTLEDHAERMGTQAQRVEGKSD